MPENIHNAAISALVSIAEDETSSSRDRLTAAELLLTTSCGPGSCTPAWAAGISEAADFIGASHPAPARAFYRL